MKVLAIMHLNNQYFYNNKARNIVTMKERVIKEETKIVETIEEDTYTRSIISNSAEYVKHAYEVSFRPLDLIVNFQ